MLKAEKIIEQSQIYKKILSLYKHAFPSNERGPLKLLLADESKHCDIIAFHDEEIFCGFACLLTHKNITHILYFAIAEDLRGHGYGSIALELIKERKSGNRIIADIESVVKGANNNAQRQRRKEFYLRNGYKLSGVAYSWKAESYEILISGGELSAKEFEDFWDSLANVNKDFSKF